MKGLLKSCWKNDRCKTSYFLGFLLLIAAFFTGIFLGGTDISVSGILSSFSENFSQTGDGRIFLYVRLPRTAAALVCGAALSVSGAVIQGVLANRLASPSIIGVNAGAGLAVTLCTALGVYGGCLLYTSPSPRDRERSRMPSSA